VKLNLGAGSVIRDGWVNVDIAPLPGVDVVWDLDVAPWPWPDGAAERIEAKDVFEHVDDPILFMTECWRVLAPAGTLRIRTPYWRSRDAFTDPTHKRFPTEHTFDYWIPGTELYRANNRAYGAVCFQRVSSRLDGGSMELIFAKLQKGAVSAARAGTVH